MNQVFVIGIPTYRRPKGLRALLESIASQRCSFPFRIVIADNEGEDGQGCREVRAMQQEGYPHPLSLVPVPERGISQARNALLEEAFDRLGADFLAMVDDDEVVDGEWIAALATMQASTGADVVGGRVLPRFEHPMPGWAEGLSVYWGRERPAGIVDIVDATNSVLFSGDFHRRHPLRFDPAYSMTGGGDKEYFLRMQALGARFAYAPSALSWEIYGASRMTRTWAIQRSFRFGADIRILLRHRSGLLFWTRELAKLGTAIPLSLIGIVVFGIFRPRRVMRPLLLLVRQIGKIHTLLGRRYDAYRVIHGQ